MLHPLSTKYLMLVSPFKNHFNSVIIVLTAIFFVVSRGNPSHIQCLICLPNTEMVPVPVRSDFSTPFCRMSINRDWYWVSNVFICYLLNIDIKNFYTFEVVCHIHYNYE